MKLMRAVRVEVEPDAETRRWCRRRGIILIWYDRWLLERWKATIDLATYESTNIVSLARMA